MLVYPAGLFRPQSSTTVQNRLLLAVMLVLTKHPAASMFLEGLRPLVVP